MPILAMGQQFLQLSLFLPDAIFFFFKSIRLLWVLVAALGSSLWRAGFSSCGADFSLAVACRL